MEIIIINSSKYRVNKSSLLRWVNIICDELKTRNILSYILYKKLIIAFVSKIEIQNLNKNFRQKNKATDILSFSPVEEDYLGELALSVLMVKQTKKTKLTNQYWLYYLILHGILHLLGFEHETNIKQAKKMYKLQDNVFDKCLKLYKINSTD